MKKSRYSAAQIVSILKEAENGVPVSELCRTHGMSSAAFYQWRSKYGGMDGRIFDFRNEAVAGRECASETDICGYCDAK